MATIDPGGNGPAKPSPAPVWRLSLMFFLFTMAEGAALVLLSGHLGALGFTGRQISYVFATGALAALVSPLVAGWLADRYWPAQQFLAGCQLISAPVLLVAWRQQSFGGFWAAFALFALIRLPSMTLTNVIAFHHLGRSERFGYVRVWGSVGWIAVTWALSLYLSMWPDQAAHLGDGLLVSAAVFAISGGYALTLPHTPPGAASAASGRSYSFAAALGLLRRPDFAVIVLVAFLSATVSPCYDNFSFLFLTSPDGLQLSPSLASWAQSLGVVVEVGVLLALASSLRRLGLKRILLVGLGAQAVRFAAFAAGGPPWLVIAAMGTHGLVFTFYFIGLVIAVEELSEPEYRASAQGLLSFARGGIGALAGQLVAGRLYDACALPGGGRNWVPLFGLPGLVVAGALVLLALLFRHQPSGRTA
jgi:MFS family permease